MSARFAASDPSVMGHALKQGLVSIDKVGGDGMGSHSTHAAVIGTVTCWPLAARLLHELQVDISPKVPPIRNVKHHSCHSASACQPTPDCLSKLAWTSTASPQLSPNVLGQTAAKTGVPSSILLMEDITCVVCLTDCTLEDAEVQET